MNRRTWATLLWPGRGVAAALVLSTAVLAQAGTGSATSPDVSPLAGDPMRVVASGPFGTVPGLSLGPEGVPPDPWALEALDAWGRNARISVSADGLSFDAWRASAFREPIMAGAEPDDLGSGVGHPVLHLPTTGLFLVRLDASLTDPTAPGRTTVASSWVWRIAVPDRDVPDGGDPYPPAPSLLLTSADDRIELDQGSGCFVGTCGDIGATAPPRTLPTIRTRPGAPLVLRLGDGSGMVAWTAEATTIAGMGARTVSLGAGTGDGAMTQGTFAAPGEGGWVILVHVTFDRDRGSFDGYGRLILGSGDR